jgi:hypothetical protein
VHAKKKRLDQIHSAVVLKFVFQLIRLIKAESQFNNFDKNFSNKLNFFFYKLTLNLPNDT